MSARPPVEPEPITEIEQLYFRQTVRVHFATPHGPVSAEVTSLQQLEVGPLYGSSYAQINFIKGEATVVRFADGGHVILLPNQLPKGLGFTLSRHGHKNSNDSRVWIKNFQALKQPILLDEFFYPYIVSFSDPNDPTSVQRIEHDNIAAILGTGYAIEVVELEPSEQLPMLTREIEDFLPWLASWNLDFNLNGERYSRRDAENKMADMLRPRTFLKE